MTKTETIQRPEYVRLPADAWDKIRGISQGLAEMCDGEHGTPATEDVAADASAILDALKNVQPDPAPEMLAALYRAAETLGNDSCDHDTGAKDYNAGVEDNCANCVVEAAIAKARGTACACGPARHAPTCETTKARQAPATPSKCRNCNGETESDGEGGQICHFCGLSVKA